MANDPKRRRQSVSQEWRTLGNESYRSAHAEGINCYTLADRMRDAICNYQRAYNSAENDNEMASAARNLGVANWKMVFLQKCTDVPTRQMHFSYKEGISFLCKAHTLGLRCKDSSWQANVSRQLSEATDEAFSFHEAFPFRQRLGPYEQYAECMPDIPHKSRCYLRIANAIFLEGITCLHDGEYKQCLNCMKECFRPVEEARRLAGEDENLLREVAIIQEDCYLHTCSAESIQARAIGDEIIEKTLQDEEEVLMSGVYDALDWYKKAILLTRENDVENEAIAHSRIGVVYDTVFKKKGKALDYFKRSFNLAASMSPRNFALDDWFKAATSAIQRFQQEVVEQENEEWNKNREKYVIELKHELDELKSQDLLKSDADFLRYVYKTFPPKKSEHKLNLPDEESWSVKDSKEALKKSLIHYHPDKQKEHGEKWVVVCEEVVKLLTRRYEQTKM